MSPTTETWAVGLDVSDALAEYVTASTGWDLTETRRLATALDETDVLLMDDPRLLSTIVTRADETRDTPADELPLKVVVAAFDPLQLARSVTDSEYEDFLKEHQVTEWRLSSSYRQKEKVGQSALRVAQAVAASSPFLRSSKKRDYEDERASLTAVANTLTFRNPSGYARRTSTQRFETGVATSPGSSANAASGRTGHRCYSSVTKRSSLKSGG